jgi:hypothetical protein
VCYGGAALRDPTDPVLERGEVCAAGFYCPAGSYQTLDDAGRQVCARSR